jgi:hypothetical protein
MKTITALCLMLVIGMHSTSFARLPLIQKVAKELTVQTGSVMEIARFDTAKFRAIRIGISRLADTRYSSYSVIGLQDDFPFRITDDITSQDIFSLSADNPFRSVAIEYPPDKVAVTTRWSGKYVVFLWGI